jgi:hypothetical protein
VTPDETRRAELVSEMYARVWANTHLWECASQVTDRLGEGRKEIHGPWSSVECQSVLIPWHSARWIELVADVDLPWPRTPADWIVRASRQGAFIVLTDQDATDLLADQARWTVGTADGYVLLSLTEEGTSHGFTDWVAVDDGA